MYKKRGESTNAEGSLIFSVTCQFLHKIALSTVIVRSTDSLFYTYKGLYKEAGGVASYYYTVALSRYNQALIFLEHSPTHLSGYEAEDPT